MTKFNELSKTELDARLSVLQALVNCPHRAYKEIWSYHVSTFSVDALFYAHLASWYLKAGKIRDHKPLMVAGLLMQHDSLYQTVGRALLSRLAPYEVKRLSEFVRKDLKREPYAVRMGIQSYLIALQNDEARFQGAAIRMRKDLRALYRSYHIKPTATANFMLFGKGEVELGTRATAVQELAAETDPSRQAALIETYKIAWPVAVGAITEMTPEILLALAKVMTPQETLNYFKQLEEYGAMSNKAASDIINDKLAQAANSSTVNMAKIDKAIAKTQDDEAKAALIKTQQAVINKTKIEGEVAWAGDVSSSMTASIDIMAQCLALFCGASVDEPLAYFFDTMAYRVRMPEDRSYQGFQEAFKRQGATGSTALGVVLSKLDRPVDSFVIITDEQQTSGTDFGSGLEIFKKRFGFYPSVIVVRVPHANLCRSFNAQEEYDQLDQLAQAVKVEKAGSELELPYKLIDPPAEILNRLVQMIDETSGRRITPDAILLIKSVDAEPFERCPIGNTASLFHGTKQGYVAKILPMGIILPRYASSSLMFGGGKYFSPQFSKSDAYTDKSHQRCIFVNDVKLGKPYKSYQAMYNITKPPEGFDSVWGAQGHTLSNQSATLRHDEFIVYQECQSCMRAVILYH